MKKIVGILAAAAVLATSVFAADVSAKVRLDGDIFSYDSTTIDAKDGKVAGSFKMLRTSTQARPYWSPYVTLSTSTDEAGAQILFIEEDDGNQNIKMDRSNVWFKPLDMLTVKVGFQDYKMNVESIDYSPVPTGEEDWGYAISYAQDAISANVFLVTGNNGWFFQDAVAANTTSKEPSAAYLKNLYINGAYEADFGKISAMFQYKGKHWDLEDVAEVAATEAHYGWVDHDDDPQTAEEWQLIPATVKVPAHKEPKTFYTDVIRFGAGYSNTIDNLSFFADVVATSYGTCDEKKELPFVGDDGLGFADKKGKPRSAFGIMADGFVCYTQDALTVKGYLRFDVDDFGHVSVKDKKLEDGLWMNDNNTKLGIKARVDYKLDNGITLFAQFNDANLLQKEDTSKEQNKAWEDWTSVFVSEIKLGANGSVGICDWETKLKIETGINQDSSADVDQNNKYNGVKLSMPIWFQVAF